MMKYGLILGWLTFSNHANVRYIWETTRNQKLASSLATRSSKSYTVLKMSFPTHKKGSQCNLGIQIDKNRCDKNLFTVMYRCIYQELDRKYKYWHFVLVYIGGKSSAYDLNWSLCQCWETWVTYRITKLVYHRYPIYSVSQDRCISNHMEDRTKGTT